jgi:uncharacterized protein (DUF2267 family)
MAATGLDLFDKTIQTTHIWLDEPMKDETIGPDKNLAWHVLGAVLRAIRDRLPVDLAAHFGSQLPILVGGTYYDQFRPADLPSRERSLEGILDGIGRELAMSRPVNLRNATRAVFAITSHQVNRGQVNKVRESLPDEVRAIWPLDADAPDMQPKQRYSAA